MARTTKAAAKMAAYDAAMRQQSNRVRTKPRWVHHLWDNKKDFLVTKHHPGFWPAPGSDWHREGPIDEFEQKENAGQRSLF
jgi:hypothetical protein